ncbi:hypothetical protein L6164_010462 [Bauhinia variegata]|uniref:Uncharacterized protein n=1 Tax=Bauhinia variegata TaxID=167791 RepID=A0ACB9PQP5_BAUVA|nr:hypothetical protein L6164_010462 [Bauhinia variegata]
MATEQALPFSAVSVVEDVLQQQANRLNDVDLASRKAEEHSLRRYEAAGWLRKTVGVVGGKDLPAEPSEEEFRIGLRSGIILCSVINKIQPGAVPKVVEASCDSVVVPEAALSAFQYFENVRNFLVAVEELGLPTFEASDLEQGGKSSRIVDCVLALKSYSSWKEGGKNGSWKYGGNTKPPTIGKPFQRKNSEQFMNNLSKTVSSDIGWQSDNYSDPGHGEFSLHSLNSLVRDYLSDKKQEEIPIVVETLLGHVMKEFERRLANQPEELRTALEEKAASAIENSISRNASDDEEGSASVDEEGPASVDEEVRLEPNIDSLKIEEMEDIQHIQEKYYDKKQDEEKRIRLLKQKKMVEQQIRDIQELKIIMHHTKTEMLVLQKRYQEEFIYLAKHMRGLASTAAGYQKVLEENRKLYNQVQDLKGNIRVYCRVRPFLSGQPSHSSTVRDLEEGNISIINPAKYGKEGKKTFSFNKAFGPTATQAEVFSDTQPLIRSVLDGYNVCIFAYGQTGSGKTHTMSGPNDLTEETVGVNYRALRDLFLLSEQRKDTICYDISVQMLEIYNEQVRDLLATDGAANKRLEIRNSSQNGINVPDANLLPVSSTSDVINLMNLGHKNRAVSATAMNDRSSRSHSCLTVHIQGRDLTSGNIIRGSMHLVDLAGSERVDKSEVKGDRLKEAVHINKSLSALGDVISALAQKSSHVPYRNSKLTQLLQDSLGGQAKTLMFVHISPEHEALGETLSTLKFAERVSTVELGAAKVHKENTDVKELKEQITNLKAALARKEAETEQFQHSVNSSAEIHRLKSNGSSPIHHSLASGGYRLPKDDASGLEGRKKSLSNLKRRSLDPQDIRNAHPWAPVRNRSMKSKEDDKESLPEDWIDKATMNRNDSLTSDDSLVGQWEAESKQSSPMLSPGYLSDSSKVWSEHSFKVTLQKKDSQDYDEFHRNRYEMATTDDYDDLEFATSDSSESDLHCQLHVPRSNSLPNGLGPKTKKSTHSKPSKIPEARSMIPSLIPTPSTSRKQGTLSSQPRKLAGAGDGKRRSGNLK